MTRPSATTQPAPPRRMALWNLGFRPLYLLASAFAALSMVLWVLQYAGYLPFTYVRGPAWHGSEMLFGFTSAVIAGFLFTAVRNWTGRPTPHGATLAGIALLWIAGRVLAATRYEAAAAFANAAFLVAVAAGIGVPLVQAGNRRNYFFVGLLAALAVAASALYFSHAGMLPWPERASLRVGLDIVMLIMAVMGGRVIPMFTNNAIPGAKARRHPLVERAGLAGLVLLMIADVVSAPPAVVVPLVIALAIVHGTRLWLWQPWRTARTPLVWILHAGYAWIVVHLAMRALAGLDLVAEPLAVHALTIGAIGGLTLGMMTRTARGHTGRPLRADRADVACYALITIAALLRVAVPLAWPAGYGVAVIAAGVCWAAAFALYALAYWPFLSRPRLDGKPG